MVRSIMHKFYLACALDIGLTLGGERVTALNETREARGTSHSLCHCERSRECPRACATLPRFSIHICIIRVQGTVRVEASVEKSMKRRAQVPAKLHLGQRRVERTARESYSHGSVSIDTEPRCVSIRDRAPSCINRSAASRALEPPSVQSSGAR